MQSKLNLGADVDSRYVMIACAADSFKPHRITNERKAIHAWLRTVPRGSRLAMESTGSYHELLADLAHQADLQVFIVNARDLRRYGQGIRRRGKTDRIGAEVIARYIAREHQELHAYVPPTDAQRLLARLIGRRAKNAAGRMIQRGAQCALPSLEPGADRLQIFVAPATKISRSQVPMHAEIPGVAALHEPGPLTLSL